MDEKVMSFVRKHDVKLNNSTIIVGVSGGPDSMALLHMLHTYRQRFNIRLIALSIDHQLRGDESKADLHYVEDKCRDWGIEYESVRIDVARYQEKQRCGTQVAARTLRYDVFSEKMKQYEADYLMLGHHGDDQIETLVMSLMRAAHSSSFIGIPFRRKFSSGFILRPLLCVNKEAIETYCEKHHINPRIDSSNEDMTYTRNYVRKHIVPKLTATNDRLHTTVQYLNESLSEDELYLMNKAKKVAHHIVNFNEAENKVTVKLNDINHLVIPLQRRVYRLILEYLYDTLPHHLSYVQEEIFLQLIQKSEGNKRINFPRNLVIEKAYGKVQFYFNDRREKLAPFHMVIQETGTRLVLPNQAVLSVAFTQKYSDGDQWTYICPAEHVNFPLTVRTRQPGDRMTYDGLQGSKKIKDILIDEKIPRNERDEIFIVEDCSGRIFWLIGLRKDRFLTAEGIKSGQYMRMTYHLNNVKGEG